MTRPAPCLAATPPVVFTPRAGRGGNTTSASTIAAVCQAGVVSLHLGTRVDTRHPPPRPVRSVAVARDATGTHPSWIVEIASVTTRRGRASAGQVLTRTARPDRPSRPAQRRDGVARCARSRARAAQPQILGHRVRNSHWPGFPCRPDDRHIPRDQMVCHLDCLMQSTFPASGRSSSNPSGPCAIRRGPRPPLIGLPVRAHRQFRSAAVDRSRSRPRLHRGASTS